MFLSLILPCYNEAAQIERTYARLAKLCYLELPEFVKRIEIIAIDDGSTDDTWAKLQTTAQIFKKATLSETRALKISLRAYRFSRNFGKEAALLAGLKQVDPLADAALVLDADLQHPPAVIPEMLNKFVNENADVIDATKANRGKESAFNKWAATSFYRFFQKESRLELQNMADFKLLSQRVVRALCELNETDRFYRALVPWLGFKHSKVDFVVADRETGTSKWSLRSKIQLSNNAFLGFTQLPQLVNCGLVALTSLVALLCVIYLIVSAFRRPLDRLDALLLALIGGIWAILVSNLANGAYLKRIHQASLKRPHYLIMDELQTELY